MRIIQFSWKLLNIIYTMDLFFIAIFAFARAAEVNSSSLKFHISANFYRFHMSVQ